jgi:hypothetical protein
MLYQSNRFNQCYSIAKTLWVFYNQRKDANQYLRSNNSAARSNYYRILAIGSIDIILTLPLGIVQLALAIRQYHEQYDSQLPFYQGWNTVHANWEPISISYSELVQDGAWTLAHQYFERWTSPLLGFAIFGLFGYSAEAQVTYRQVSRAVCKALGWKLYAETQSDPSEVMFGEPEWKAAWDVEQGYATHLHNIAE